MDRLRRTQSRRDLRDPRGLRGLGTTSRIDVRPEARQEPVAKDSSDNFEPFQVVKLSKITRPEPDYCDRKPHPVMWMAPPFHSKRDMCNLQYRYADWPENQTRTLLLSYPMPILHGYCLLITANSLPEAYPHVTYNPNRRLREFTLTTTSHTDARNILNLLRGHAEDGITLDRFSDVVDKKSKPRSVAEKALRAARDVGIPVLEEFFEGKLMLAGEGFVEVDGEEAKMAEAEDVDGEGDEDGDGWELL